MGMFDYLRCRYPLPVDGANDRLFQTKDTPAQYMDMYEIREDGSLWGETKYDIEDHSDFALGKGSDKFVGCMARVNKQWVQETDFTGEICFYDFKRDPKNHDYADAGWLEFSAYFLRGQLQQLNVVQDRDPKDPKS